MKGEFVKRAIFMIIIVALFAGSFAGCGKKGKKNQGSKKPKQEQLVKVNKRKLLVDFNKDKVFDPCFIKGVNYNPMPVGRHPNDMGWKKFEGGEEPRIDNIFDDEALLERDFKLLKEMGCNTIRLWKANSTFKKGKNRFTNRLTKKTLDMAEKYGIKVIAGFWLKTKPPQCGNSGPVYKTQDYTKEGIRKKHKKAFSRFVNNFKKHPAILFWAIGNGNNEDLDPMDFDQMQAFYSMIDEMAKAAHKIEGRAFHPVAFVNNGINTIGEIIYETEDINMPNLDIWGANVYRGESFGDLFEDYAQRSEKPLWIAEYGLDSWVSVNYASPGSGQEDQETQAKWVGKLWDEIAANKDVVIGATIKEYSDEWWRPVELMRNRKHHRTHDYFGFGPKDSDCDGYLDWFPEAPDKFFHEEWFGLVSIEEGILDPDKITPKKAYYTLKEKFTGN